MVQSNSGGSLLHFKENIKYYRKPYRDIILMASVYYEHHLKKQLQQKRQDFS